MEQATPIYLIQARVAGRWTTVGNRLCKSSADKLADMWAAETSHEYRVMEILR